MSGDSLFVDLGDTSKFSFIDWCKWENLLDEQSSLSDLKWLIKTGLLWLVSLLLQMIELLNEELVMIGGGVSHCWTLDDNHKDDHEELWEQLLELKHVYKKIN